MHLRQHTPSLSRTMHPRPWSYCKCHITRKQKPSHTYPHACTRVHVYATFMRSLFHFLHFLTPNPYFNPNMILTLHLELSLKPQRSFWRKEGQRKLLGRFSHLPMAGCCIMVLMQDSQYFLVESCAWTIFCSYSTRQAVWIQIFLPQQIIKTPDKTGHCTKYYRNHHLSIGKLIELKQTDIVGGL